MSEERSKRLLGYVCELRARAEKLAEARDALSEMRADGLVIAEGERAFIEDLTRLLEGVDQSFEAARARLEAGGDTMSPEAQSAPVDPVGEALARAERPLADPRWQLLQPVLAAIQDKRKKQQEREKQFNDTLKAVAEKLAPLRASLDEARRFNAATVREQDDLWKINRRYEQANTSVTVRRAAAYQEMDLLAQEAQPIDATIAGVREKTDLAKKIRKRADLLLLQSPLDARKLHHYTALLRTASEPGVQGISLHASSSIVVQDREGLSERMARITDLLRQGKLRAPGADIAAARSAEGQPSAAGAAPGPTPGAAQPASLREIAPFGPAPASPSSPIEEVSLVATGELMYRLLLPEPVQRYLETSTCSLSLTTNDLELPWELMHDGVEHLCLRRPTARMPMGTYLPPQSRAFPSAEKIRFLFVRPSEDLPAAKKEVDEIQTALSSLGEVLGRKLVIKELGPKEATGHELNRALMSGEYHVVHFAGHAEFNEADPDQSALLLADDERFLAQKARRILGGRPLVFLNACESGAATAMTAGGAQANLSYLQGPAGGLASAFVYGGALGCVGAIWPVYDDGASFLATELYKELLQGAMIGEAMRAARVRTRTKYPDQVTWASFVLYGDPTFQLL